MAAKRYIALVAGKLKQIAATVVSAGAGNDGDLVALDATGKLDNSVLPTGVGAETKQVLTSEALAAGDWVNVYNNAGVANVRKADASSPAKYANGFVLAAFGAAVNATVYTEGVNNQVAGQTVGTVYLSDVTPGAGVAVGAIPTVAGHIVQQVGEALSATEVTFEPQPTVELA
jgi:hypothetical protein